MRTIRYLSSLLFCASLIAATQAAESTSVRAILVIASKQPGKSDSRLAPYEATLKRILRFESFQFVGDDSATVSSTGEAKLTLGQGHSIELSGGKSGGGNHRLKADWTHNGQSLMNTGLQLRPGVPAVIGGPASGTNGDAFAVILIAN